MTKLEFAFYYTQQNTTSLMADSPNVGFREQPWIWVR